MNFEQEQKLNEVYAFMKAMQANATIPFDVSEAIKARLTSSLVTTTSSKTVASETQAVNEGGMATYNVAKPMDGFEEGFKDGQLRYYPYYT